MILIRNLAEIWRARCYPPGEKHAVCAWGIWGTPPTEIFKFWVAPGTHMRYTRHMSCEKILDTLLHSTLALSLKTQHFHWCVTGPTFGPLHDLFGKQYSDLQEAADTLAERIRALDAFPHAHNSNADAEAVDPIPAKPPKHTKMLEILALDHEKLALFAARTSSLLAESDPATSNLLAERQMAHQKAAWMLKSHLAA